jgi:DNA-binding MarR family transcriptional regulator
MWLTMLKPNAANILKAIVEKSPHDLEELRINEIAEQSGVCRNTVRCHIKALAAHGYITIWRDTAGAPYCFEVLPKARTELKPDDNR